MCIFGLTILKFLREYWNRNNTAKYVWCYSILPCTLVCIYMWPKIAHDWSYLPKKMKFIGSGFNDTVEDHCWIPLIVWICGGKSNLSIFMDTKTCYSISKGMLKGWVAVLLEITWELQETNRNQIWTKTVLWYTIKPVA